MDVPSDRQFCKIEVLHYEKRAKMRRVLDFVACSVAKKYLFLFGFSLVFEGSPARGWDGLAVLGDSISTGAASHPALSFDPLVLWSVVSGGTPVKPLKSDVPGGDAFGLKETLDPPRRLWPAFRENDGGSGWIWLHTVQALSRAALDTEEYSYGYLFGRSLGLEPENIWIAGDNGTRAEHSAVHAARVLQAARGELPSRVLILYTGNDLCAPTWELMTDTESYGEGLRRGIMFLARHGHTAGQQPTKVYVPAVLAITGLISENSILDKKIKFYGTEITCREARKRMFAAPDVVLGREEVSDPRYPFFAQLLPPNPALLCPTLFSRAAEEPAKLSIIANRIRAYREVQKSVVESINKEIAARPELARLDVQFIENTGRVLFQGEDVSGDCFHLSPRGQAKVAQSLVASIPK